MRSILVLVFLLAVLSGTHTQTENAEAGTTIATDAEIYDTVAISPAELSINNNRTIKGGPELQNGRSTSARQTSAQTEVVMTRPAGPGIHAGFQATGPNFQTTASGGIKSSDGATIETGLNFASRFGDSTNTRSPTQQTGSTQQQSARSTQGGAGAISSSLPLDGATFAVSYNPGLLSTIGNMFNPIRMFHQFGNALSSLTAGFGQGNTMSQAQSQYSPPQASRLRSNGTNNNGVGITWKPLYRVLWP